MKEFREVRDSNKNKRATSKLNGSSIKKALLGRGHVAPGDDENSPLCADTFDDVSVDMSSVGPLPADLKATVEEFQEIETAIRRVTAQLDELQRRKVRSHFRSEAEERRDTHEMSEATQTLSAHFKKADRKLAELEVVASLGGTDAKAMYHNMRCAYSARFSALAQVVKDNQRKYVAQTQKQTKASMFKKDTKVDTVVDQLDKEEAMDRYMDRGLSEDQAHILLHNESQMKERDSDIRELLTSLTSLHDIFKDVNTLVLEQGTILDQIDYNLVKSKDTLVKATEELNIAVKHQEAGRFKLCVLFLVMLILGFVVAIVMKHAV
jgi:syntaxin 16